MTDDDGELASKYWLLECECGIRVERRKGVTVQCDNHMLLYPLLINEFLTSLAGFVLFARFLTFVP